MKKKSQERVDREMKKEMEKEMTGIPEWKELKGWRQLVTEEDGMGTVEIILIIVEILTLRKQGILC